MKTSALYAKSTFTLDDILVAVTAGIDIGAYSSNEYAIGRAA
jgi:hypothetical protein